MEVKRKLQIVIILLVAAAAAASAQDSNITREGDLWIQVSTGTLPAARNLNLTTSLGSVRIEGGAENQIRYTVRKQVRAASEQEARRMLDSVRISAGEKAGTAWIRGRAHGRQENMATDFVVEAPSTLQSVEALTGGGILSVGSIRGSVHAQTGGGAMDLNAIGGVINGSSGGGNVQVTDAGSNVKIETGGGSVQINSARGTIDASSGGGNLAIVSGDGNMQLSTGGGSISVQHCGGNLKASTGGGVITVGDVHGKADLETGGGVVELASASGPVRVESGGGTVELHQLAGGAWAETGGGSILAEFVGSRSRFTNSRLETAGGDIRVFLPANLAVTVDAAIDVADGHSIHTDFNGLKVVSQDGFGPKESYCRGELNGGGPTLHVHTTTGNIDLLRTAAVPQKR